MTDDADEKLEWFMLSSAQLVFAASFLLIFGLAICPAGIDWYIANIPLPEGFDAERALIGLKIAGMVLAAGFGTTAFVIGSCWLVISTIFYGIEQLISEIYEVKPKEENDGN